MSGVRQDPQGLVIERCCQAVERLDWVAASQYAADNVTVVPPSGHVYVGRAGLARFLTEQLVSLQAARREESRIHGLGNGFVLLEALFRITLANGEELAVPGAWLFHIEDGLITSVHFFRTGEAARRAVPDAT
jgi:hypothetical protein